MVFRVVAMVFVVVTCEFPGGCYDFPASCLGFSWWLAEHSRLLWCSGWFPVVIWLIGCLGWLLW